MSKQKIYIGKTKAQFIDWLKNEYHYTPVPEPVTDPKTHIKFVDGTEDDYLIEGVMDCPALIAAGLMPPESGTSQPPSWVKQPLEANIGSHVTSIGDVAFYNCSGLTSVTIPDTVTSIGNDAFAVCIQLTNVTLGNNVDSIGFGAFGGCQQLTKIIIPNSVTSIQWEAFINCYNLMDVTFSGKTIEQVQSMGVSSWELPSGCVLHCTDGDIII